jgi:hypothetical protein
MSLPNNMGVSWLSPLTAGDHENFLSSRICHYGYIPAKAFELPATQRIGVNIYLYHQRGQDATPWQKVSSNL